MSDPITAPRLVIAGIGSSSGKTTVALGIVNALRNRGRAVQTFKIGSDLIDSAYLAHASQRPCRTLDSWLLGEAGVRASFARAMGDADCAVIEGVGGIFDGHGVVRGPRDGVVRRFPGSTADVATIIGAPVVLVIDVAVMGETAAAVALGISRMDERLSIIGVILNNSENANRRGAVEDAVWELARIPVLGTLPHMPGLHIPGAHHHVVPLTQNPAVDAGLDEAGAIVSRHCNLDLLERLMESASTPFVPPAAAPTAKTTPVRIGVAFDDAFCYYYPENLELLEAAGAEIVTLSPLEDHSLPRDIDGIYLGGGILEAYIPRLAANRGFMESLRRAHQHGLPIYAECGGALYVARSLEVHDGSRHDMAGLLGVDLTVSGARGRDRYREVVLSSDTLLGTAGTRLRGHEFHNASRTDGTTTQPHAYTAYDSDGIPVGCEGWCDGNLVASLVHLHFGQDDSIAHRFVKTARHAAGQRRFTTA